jgi:mRNA interferase MazF
MKKTQPCVIVSSDEMNDTLGTVIVVPLTSTVRNFPFYVPVNYRDHKGALACDQIKTIDKLRIGEQYEKLTTKDAELLSIVLTSMFQVN